MILLLTVQSFLSHDKAEPLLAIRLHATIIILLKIPLLSDLEQLAMFPFSISP